MSTNAPNQLKQFQRTLYEKAYQEAHSFPALSTASIKKYAGKYYKSLPQNYQRATLGNILNDLDQSTVLLYGDFHTLKQAQRGLLRILRDYIRLFPQRRIVLALEMFKAKDQAHLNAYANGLISEEELLQETRYSQEWGFPWDHYRGLIDFALEHDIPFVGVNTDAGGRDKLQKRDEYSADIIQRLHRQDPERLIVCMIGEFHLADEHLPMQLQKNANSKSQQMKMLRIVTNVDDYYFREPYHQTSPNTEYLQLKGDLYCILNTPPWIKWQSFILWEEMRNIGSLNPDDFDDDGSDIYTEESFDLEYRILTLIKNLASFLNIPSSAVDFSRFSAYYQPDQETFNELIEKYDLDENELHIIVERASMDGFYYISRANAFIINDISLNNLAEVSGIFLFNSLNTISDENDGDQFYFRILEYAAGMIASKILNPRRKGADIWSYRKFIAASSRRRLIGHAKTKRDAAKRLISFHEWISKKSLLAQTPQKPLPSTVRADHQFHYEISCTLGRILGFTLYTKVMRQAVGHDFIRDILQPRRNTQNRLVDRFVAIYETIMH